VAWETSIIAGFAESALEREVAEADTDWRWDAAEFYELAYKNSG
jgi:hypothetical protein